MTACKTIFFSSQHVSATSCLIQPLCSPLCLGKCFYELGTGECTAIRASSQKLVFSVHTMLGFVSSFCSLTCRKMSQMNVLDTVINELNADDQPDEEWLHLDIQQLEERLQSKQRTLRLARLERSDKLRRVIARLGRYIEKLRSKNWLNQVRIEAT